MGGIGCSCGGSPSPSGALAFALPAPVRWTGNPALDRRIAHEVVTRPSGDIYDALNSLVQVGGSAIEREQQRAADQQRQQAELELARLRAQDSAANGGTAGRQPLELLGAANTSTAAVPFYKEPLFIAAAVVGGVWFVTRPRRGRR